MTVLEAIHAFDSLKPNAYSQEQKITWLDRLDSFVRVRILEAYPRLDCPPFTPGDPDRALLMQEPFTDAYIHWLESKVHYYNEETDRYNDAVRMFRGVFEDYQRDLIQRNAPKNPGVFQF